MGSSVADAEDSEEVVSLLDSEVAEVSAVVCVSEMVVLLVDSICDDAHEVNKHKAKSVLKIKADLLFILKSPF